MRRIATTAALVIALGTGLVGMASPAQAAAYGCSSWQSGNGGSAYCPAGGGSFRVKIVCGKYNEWIGYINELKEGPWRTAGLGSNSSVNCTEGFEYVYASVETR